MTVSLDGTGRAGSGVKAQSQPVQVRSHRSRRPSLRSARASEARVSWITADRTGSGGNGTGLLRTMPSSVRSVGSPAEQVEHDVPAEPGGADAQPGVAGRVG